MSTHRKSGNGAAQTAAAADPFAPVSDLQRAQVRAATQAMCAVFRGFEAMRKVQEHAAHRALTQHASVVERLSSPMQASELMGIQSQLLKFDLEGAAQYWQNLWSAAMQMQSELSNCTLHMMDDDGLRRAASAWQSVPLFQMPAESDVASAH